MLMRPDTNPYRSATKAIEVARRFARISNVRVYVHYKAGQWLVSSIPHVAGGWTLATSTGDEAGKSPVGRDWCIVLPPRMREGSK